MNKQMGVAGGKLALPTASTVDIPDPPVTQWLSVM